MKFNPTIPMWANLLWKGGKIPKAAPSAPPVTERQTEVQQAKRDAAKILRKKSAFLNSTTLAGETGGGVNTGSKSNLLG